MSLDESIDAFRLLARQLYVNYGRSTHWSGMTESHFLYRLGGKQRWNASHTVKEFKCNVHCLLSIVMNGMRVGVLVTYSFL